MNLQETHRLIKLDQAAESHRCRSQANRMNVVGYMPVEFRNGTYRICISKGRQFGHYAAAKINGRVVSEYDQVASVAFVKLCDRLEKVFRADGFHVGRLEHISN